VVKVVTVVDRLEAAEARFKKEQLDFTALFTIKDFD
jgi:orotate phosphoribosyltransferase